MNKKIWFVLLLALVVFVAGCSSGSSGGQDTTQIGGGSQVPDFSVTTVDGSTAKLSDFLGAGKPVMLYFFASWCPNCARDFNELQKVYPTYKNDVVLLAVDVDPQESAGTIISYQAKYPGLAGAIFAQADTNLLSMFRVKYTTTKFAINRQGNVIFSNSGAIGQAQWTSLLEDLKNS